MEVGKRIYLQRRLPSPDVLKGFAGICASNVCDVMNRNNAMNPRIRLMSSPAKKIMIGAAFTVKLRAGDNLVLHAAMNYCGEGDVLVVSNEENYSRALAGEIMLEYMRNTSKISGIVIDGPIRDIDEISKWDFPVYAAGTTPAGPYKDGPGELNVSITCGNIVVNPGDIFLADADGVIVIPLKDAPEILEEARKYKEIDNKKVEDVKKGSLDRTWVNKELHAKGYNIINDIY